MTQDFYSPASINFSRHQIPFLIKHLPLLRIGSWPPDFKITGYSGGPKRGQKHGSYFETPVSIAAEIDHRLESAGIDGIMLELICLIEPEDRLNFENHLAQALRTDLDSIDKRIKSALSYCSGWRRKAMGYRVWKMQRNYRRKKKNDYHGDSH